MPTEAPLYGHNGYISDMLSEEDSTFDPLDPPTLTLTFPEVHDVIIPGVTITWSKTYNEWATEYSVTAYHGERLVFFQTATNDEVESVLVGDITDYDKIVIQVLAWCKPQHRARIEDIFLGIESKFTKAEIMSYEATMSVDPLSAALPKSEINFSIPNVNQEYNPDNPNGISKYLMERQQVTVRYGYKIEKDVQNPEENVTETATARDSISINDNEPNIEWIPGGVYFLSEWETPQNGITAGFTARDALEFMTDTYEGPVEGTLMDVAVAAFEQANLPLMEDSTVRWEVDGSLAQIAVPASLTGGEDEEGKVIPPSTDLSQLTLATVLQYVANAACCVFYQDRAGKIYIKPLDVTPSDYDINQFNSYSNAELTLSKQLKAINVNNGQYNMVVGKAGDTQPVTNPFISDEQAPAVAKWIASYLENRKTLTGEFRADPRLDPLDMVYNENQFARALVLVTEASFTYNGAFRGSYSGRSMVSAMATYFYSGDLYSGEV